MERRTELQQKLKTSQSDAHEGINKAIIDLEHNISKLSSKESYEKVREKNFQNLSNLNGSCSSNGMWKIRRKTFPKKQT